MKLPTKKFDAIVIGAGGAGMRTALQLSKSGLSCALISKVFPIRSHTVSAQGGITVSLGNSHKDNWKWHMYDTVKGSDYLGDQDAIEYMCKTGPEAIIELEHMGLPFSRLKNGKIYQRAFGGQSINYGEKQAMRTAAAADRTGHALLYTLYQENIKYKTKIFAEWYSLDLVKNQDSAIVGAIVLCIATGEIFYFESSVTVLATGGAGRIYQSTTNAYINTGDGIGMALRVGVPVQDMEMWQFHPTGIAGVGILITEACRGEGGYLVNRYGERFMGKYAPKSKDLASRDVVSRSIMLEIMEGKGYESNNFGIREMPTHVKLKLNHLDKKLLESRLPGILALARTFSHVDPVKELIPVFPTCHYMMGGLPTKINGQVITLNNKEEDTIVPGLFAVGEVACVSVHGANRLGGNSLLDIVVFGRSTGLFIQKFLKNGFIPHRKASGSDIDLALSRYIKWNRSKGKEKVHEVRTALQKCMQNYFSVFREGKAMSNGLKEIQEIKNRLKNIALDDKSLTFNSNRIECLELENMVETAYSTALSANFRTESRGAHNRIDFPNRDDKNWLYHTIYLPENNIMKLRKVNMKPIACRAFKPKIRTY